MSKPLLLEMQGTVLYENSSGISSGSFTLNDDVSNYKRLVFYADNNKAGECFADASEHIAVNVMRAGSSALYIISSTLNRSGNTFTFYANHRSYYTGSVWAKDTAELVKITKVVGYKY